METVDRRCRVQRHPELLAVLPRNVNHRGQVLSARFPIRPLLELVTGEAGHPLSGRELAVRLGTCRTTLLRARVVGLSESMADRLASHAGWHPLVIWGDAWAEVA